MLLVSCVGEIVLHSHPNPISEEVGNSITIPNGGLPTLLPSTSRPCIQVLDAAGKGAGFVIPSWVASGPLLEEGGELPPKKEHTIYIVPETFRAASERTDLASVASGGFLIMSPWEPAE